MWRANFLADVVSNMVDFDNSIGSVTKPDIELTRGILHNECDAQCFNVKERNILNCTDNKYTLWWQKKGSATIPPTPAHLLCN